MDRNTLDLDSYPEIPEACVVLDGVKHRIGPFAGRKISKAAGLVAPLMRYFAAFQDTGEQRVDVAYLLEKHWDLAVELVVLATDLDMERIEALAADQQADLMRLVLRVNIDFFFRRFQPSLGRIAQDAAVALASASAKPGSGSSTAATRPARSWLTPWRKSSGGSSR